jgi:hypothetical protein
MNVGNYQAAPFISGDGLTLYFQSTNQPEFVVDETDVWVARRSSRNEPFGDLEPVTDVNQDFVYDAQPSASSDELELYFSSSRSPGGIPDLFVAKRTQRGDGWGEPELLDELSSPEEDYAPRPTTDGLVMFFGSYRAGGRGSEDLYLSTRASKGDPWGPAVSLGSAVNSSTTELGANLSPDGAELWLTRTRDAANDQTRDLYIARVLPFDRVQLTGHGGVYQQTFDTLGVDTSQADTPVPSGWTFTANDIVFNNTTTDRFPALRRNYAGVYNGGVNGDADRALVTDYAANGGGELDLRVEVTDDDLQAVRLEFDLEAWQVFSSVGNGKGEAAFHVVLEADAGGGFTPVADLGTVTTGPTLSPPAAGQKVNGNDAAYRIAYDSGPLDVDVPKDATLRVRWISTDVAQQEVVFGLDNVSLRFAAPGDANIDGVFNSTDLIDVLANGEYEDNIADNSTWSEGDWNSDNEFDSSDLIEGLAAGYDSAAATAAVPEPSSFWLGLIGAAVLALRRR